MWITLHDFECLNQINLNPLVIKCYSFCICIYERHWTLSLNMLGRCGISMVLESYTKLRVFLHPLFFKSLYFFLKWLVEFTGAASELGGSFSCPWRIFIKNSTPLMAIWIFYFYFCVLISTIFQEICSFHPACQLFWHKGFLLFFFLTYFITNLLISVASVVIFPLSFLKLASCVSLNLDKCCCRLVKFINLFKGPTLPLWFSF